MASTPAAMRLRRSSSWPAASVVAVGDVERGRPRPDASACALMEQIISSRQPLPCNGVGDADDVATARCGGGVGGSALVLRQHGADAREREGDRSGACEQLRCTCDPCDSFSPHMRMTWLPRRRRRRRSRPGDAVVLVARCAPPPSVSSPGSSSGSRTMRPRDTSGVLPVGALEERPRALRAHDGGARDDRRPHARAPRGAGRCAPSGR